MKSIRSSITAAIRTSWLLPFTRLTCNGTISPMQYPDFGIVTVIAIEPDILEKQRAVFCLSIRTGWQSIELLTSVISVVAMLASFFFFFFL